MGVFSKFIRYRDAGEEANVENVARYGEPHHSLFTSAKVFTLHKHIDITDENENVMYQADSKVISIKDKTDIVDKNGNHVAHIERKIWSPLREIHYITMADGTAFELNNQIWHLVKDITDINGLGWQLRGNIAALNFEIVDADENIVAVIGQKLISLHDKYAIDIYKPEYEAIVVAIVIGLQHIMRDRAASSTSFSGGSSSGGN